MLNSVLKYGAAMVAIGCVNGIALAQTTTLVDATLNVPTYLQSSASFTVSDTGSLFYEGATIQNPIVDGTGYLESGSTVVDQFSLTNGTVGSPVFNHFILGPGTYTFLYDFANSNSTVGGQIGLTATVTALPAPEIDASSAIAGMTLLGGGLAALRGRRSGPSRV